ncbi:MAG: UvrD-helicase domain-containing protein, partial [Selenomonadales bacterium]|nr:UvrD-helicase domain-containing protein [Selenomonadales bacterium]
MNEILDGLNEQQRRAVETLDGPLLVVAGAGSGKTKVLTCRIANLLYHGVRPWNILAITFTNKAAAEMKERVEKLIGPQAKDIWLSTFHSFCARFLRMEIENIPGYQSNFVIYDTTDTKTVVRSCLKELNLDEKQYQPSTIQAVISNAKNALIDARSFQQQASTFFDKKVGEVFELYETKLRNNNALDFDDLLLFAVHILSTNEEVREKYQEKFHYVLIDEYQDTNRAQYLLAHLLSGASRNLCVVGDIDQSIYGWRGADIRNILDFEKDYPEAVVIKLEQNYRSTKNILASANAVIEHNSNRKPKKLWTENATGEPITYFTGYNEREEAQYIADRIMECKTLYHAKYGDIAILYRPTAQSRALEEGLMRTGIPYTMVGGLKFYERKEIKDVLAYLRVIYNPQDAVSLTRIINVPKRGIGDASIAKLEAYAEANEMTLFDAIANHDMVEGLSKKVRSELERLAELIFCWMNEQGSVSIEQLIGKVIEESGYLAE